jgi:hypothetical protein
VKAKDLTGQRFGRLKVVSQLPSGSRGEARWKCDCDCGNETPVRASNLMQGVTRSCGCLKRSD